MPNTQQVGWWSRIANAVNYSPPLTKGGEGGFKDSYQELGHCKNMVDCLAQNLAQRVVSSNWLPITFLAGAVTRNKWVKVGSRLVTSDDGPPYYADKLGQKPKFPEEMAAEAFRLLDRVNGEELPGSRRIIAANRDAFKLFGWVAKEYNKRGEFAKAAEAFGWQGDLRGRVDADTSVFLGIYSNEAEAWAHAIDAAKGQRQRAYLTHRYGNALIKTGRFEEGNAAIDSAVAYYEGTARNAKLRRLANQIISKVRSYQATLLLEKLQPGLAAVNFERAAEATDGRQKAEMFKRAILLKNAGDAWMKAGGRPAAAAIDYRKAQELLKTAGRADSPLYREIEPLRRDAAAAMIKEAHKVTDPPGAGPKDDQRLPKETDVPGAGPKDDRRLPKETDVPGAGPRVDKRRPPKESGPDVPGAGRRARLDKNLLRRAAEGNSDALRKLARKAGKDFIERLASRDRALLKELRGSDLTQAGINRLVRSARGIEGAATSVRGAMDARRRRGEIKGRGK